MKPFQKRQIVTLVLSVLAATLFVITLFFCSRPIPNAPMAQGTITQTQYVQNAEGTLTPQTVTKTLGQDFAAVRINDLKKCNQISFVNYVPNEFVQPQRLPDEVQIVDLTKPFDFAERGSLILILLNLDPASPDFTKDAEGLDIFRRGDSWRFSLFVPLVFSASNIYLDSELVARNGTIEHYEFIKYTDSFDLVTNDYSPHPARTALDLSFRTKREAIAADPVIAGEVICIHYESSGSVMTGMRDAFMVGLDTSMNNIESQSQFLIILAFALAGVACAVIIVLSVLKRSFLFFPEALLTFGILLFFFSGYIFARSTTAPLFVAALNQSAPFLFLGAALLAAAPSRKAGIFSSLIALCGFLLSFITPFTAFHTAGVLNIIVAIVRGVGSVAVIALATYSSIKKQSMHSLRGVQVALVSVAAFAFQITHYYPIALYPPYWLILGATIVSFFIGFSVFRDTERRNEQLLANLSLEVDRQVKDIRAIITERDNLLQFVSHDMKKPLLSSEALLATLLDRERDEEQQKGLRIVKQHTERVLENLSEIAAYARFNYIAEASQSIDLQEVCASIYKYCAPDCEAAGIVLKNQVNKPYEIFAKRQGLENALTNILLNAVEHAECSTIELNATHERGHVLITVTDDGKGVDPAIDAFRPYVSENKPDTGGLGLYLCKQIVESMNGTLSYESCAGKTVFTIKLLKA